MIFHGPHGYVSASWYGRDTVPTWNHVTLHVRGTPEPLPDALPVLRRTVEHFESRVERPRSLDRMGEAARETADQVVAFRLRASSWHAEAKLSQDKPAEERGRVLAGLEAPGPYRNPEVAAAMRASGGDRRAAKREPGRFGRRSMSAQDAVPQSADMPPARRLNATEVTIMATLIPVYAGARVGARAIGVVQRIVR
jgi:hypothetical protein